MTEFLTASPLAIVPLGIYIYKLELFTQNILPHSGFFMYCAMWAIILSLAPAISSSEYLLNNYC